MQNKVTACSGCDGCGTPRIAFKANLFALVGIRWEGEGESGALCNASFRLRRGLRTSAARPRWRCDFEPY